MFSDQPLYRLIPLTVLLTLFVAIVSFKTYTLNPTERKVMKFIYAVFFSILLILPIESVAQTVVSDKIQKRGKTRVNVPVTVADREGRYLTGLKKDDFTLYEDDVEKKIVSFSTLEEPINVALLLDTSGSTKDSLEEIKKSAAEFVGLLNQKDKCLIATFDSQINILSTLTNDHKELENSLQQARTNEKEGSVLFNAIKQITQKSFADVEGRKVIIVLSDGKDFGSSIAKNALISQLEESDVSIYSIFYQTGGGFNKLTITDNGKLIEGDKSAKSEPVKKKKKKKKYSIIIPTRSDSYSAEEAKSLARAADAEAVNTLQTMLDTTAGRFYQSDTQNLRGVFKKISGELRQMYQLAYDSDKVVKDVSVRQIIVKVKRDDAVVRARGKFRAEQL